MLKIPEKKKLFLFLLGNNLAFWYEIGTTFFLTEFSKWWYAASYGFALATSIFLLFSYYVTFVFKVDGDGLKRLRNFILLVIFVYFTNWILVLVITEETRLNYIASIVLVGLIVAGFTYHLNEYFVFYD